MKKIIFIILIFLILKISLAQVNPYFSYKKVNEGIMVGVEIIDEKNKKTSEVLSYKYDWQFPEVSLNFQRTNDNLKFVFLNQVPDSLLVKLKIFKPFTKINYQFDNKIILKKPKIVIVRKSNSLYLPLSLEVEKDDILTFLLKDFSSKKIQYLWEFNGNFVSNEKEIYVGNLKEKEGTITLRIFGYNPNENLVVSQYLKIR